MFSFINFCATTRQKGVFIASTVPIRPIFSSSILQSKASWLNRGSIKNKQTTTKSDSSTSKYKKTDPKTPSYAKGEKQKLKQTEKEDKRKAVEEFLKKYDAPTKKFESIQQPHISPMERREQSLMHKRQSDNKKEVRINKLIATLGVCSRRKADDLIAQGRVKVNGEKITTPALDFDPSTANIEIDGQRIFHRPMPTKLWLYHKPKGVLITHSDELALKSASGEGRITLADVIRRKGLPSHTLSVGRLDYNTEGVLLLSNNGSLVQHLAHPSNNYTRVYRVLVHGDVTQEKLAALERGIYIAGDRLYHSMKAVIEPNQSDTTNQKRKWLKLTLTEGKNRQIRNALEALHLTVVRLIRTEFGPFTLRDTQPGSLYELKLRDDLAKFAD